MKKNLIVLIITYLFFHLNSGIKAQSNGSGAIFLSSNEYAQLPRPNWDTLRKYSLKNSISQSNLSSNSLLNSSTGITMLVSPSVGFQGSQQSCVGWAFGYTAMGILTYPKYYCWAAAERSPSYIYNQIKLDQNCNFGGSVSQVGANLIKEQGVCAYSLMPYVYNDCATQPNLAQPADAAQNKAYDWRALDKNDVNGIKMALDLGFPVVNTFALNSDFNTMWYYGGGIWNTNSTQDGQGHATCIIGYDDTKQMFKVQNQWGTSGGDNGYYWVTYDLVRNNCMSELFIIYGTNNSNLPSINGNDLICSSENFSINNYQLMFQ
jgi:C1A family cysteine protease